VNDLFLGIIAVAVLAIAIAQIGVMVAAGRVARRLERLTEQLERDVAPLFGHLNAVGKEASRAAALATRQVERADELFADIAGRIDVVLNSLQSTLSVPAQEARALLRAFRAAVAAVRGLRRNGRRRSGRSDDEDALFI
jgi:hypothetical protein